MNNNYMTRVQQDDPSLGNAELLAEFERAPADLRQAVAGMTREQVLARPVAGKWSTLELVSHLADMDLVYADRIARTLALDRPLLIGVDENQYAARLKYQERDFDGQLALFAALRTHSASLIRSQPAEAWQRTAIHSETGLVTLRQLVLQGVRHIRHHLPFIAEKRAALP